jgi:cell division protein FtsL
MIRPVTALWIIAVCLSCYGMMKIKDEVYRLRVQLQTIERDTARSRDRIRTLNAEWSFLTQPTRLGDLAKRYLKLSPVTNAQLGRVETLPQRPSVPPATTLAGSAQP